MMVNFLKLKFSKALIPSLMMATVLDGAVFAAAAENLPVRASKPQRPERKVFTGKVVFLADALKLRGITAFDEIKTQVVLETDKGELIPIVPDWRGRAFYQDKRLRNRKVQLVGYRRRGVPYLQVLMVFLFDKKGVRNYFDYWCDICSIPMYEIKPCDCCQGEIRLRFQPRKLPDYIHRNHIHRNHKKDTVPKTTTDRLKPSSK
jgi:hypothetical protein